MNYPKEFERHDNTKDGEHGQCNFCGFGVKKETKECPFCGHNPKLIPLKMDENKSIMR